MSQKVIVTGAGGFIGHHLVNDLKLQGHWVRGVDHTTPKWEEESQADEYLVADLRTQYNSLRSFCKADVAYLLAADMGGLGYMEGKDIQMLYENTRITIETIEAAIRFGIGRIVFASSTVVYPDSSLYNNGIMPLAEEDARPFDPMEGGYGWAKLFGEKVCEYFADRDQSIIPVRIGNTYGPEGSWSDGREKAPAAICRKVAMAKKFNQKEIEVWGDGEQRRTFTYIDDTVLGLQAIALADETSPVNLASEEEVTINELVEIVSDIAEWPVKIKHVDGPVGARRRLVDTKRYRDMTGMQIKYDIRQGLEKTYAWIEEQVNKV